MSNPKKNNMPNTFDKKRTNIKYLKYHGKERILRKNREKISK
jgi:hypothetical protein